MKFSHTLLGAASTLALATSGGCIFISNGVGDVEFSYVLLVNDGTGTPVAASSCEEVGISEVRVLFGTDQNFDGLLDDFEVEDQASDFCNQLDFDGDGNLLQDEFGFFEGQIFAGTYDLFAVEFINDAGIRLGWQTFDTNDDFVRFSFAGGISVFAGNNNIIPFSGDQFQTPSQELQAFFGFDF
jgi:hypothetical protein